MESDILMLPNVTHHKKVVYLLGQHSRFMFILSVIAKLNLDLQGSELNCSLQGDRVGPIKNCLLGLFIKEIELDGIAENSLVKS